MNILVPLLLVGRENRNHFAGFIQGSAVFKWNSETSKAHQAIIFALKPQNLTIIMKIFSTFPFICLVTQCLHGAPVSKT